ncbi:MAG: ShlB/FhaC/HecB family hemolysin secretion/activation protein [Alphaproteobacteria bacterium]|nr:ShlB/FhaC/HecB family hemolysin secretion/activation protein [Alphaproteobacteria bacterium]
MSSSVLADNVDPQRVEERLPTESARPDKDASTTTTPLKVDEADLASIPQFTLRSTSIEGLISIDRAEADACIAPLMGTTVGAASLVGLTQCLTKLYRDRGFFLSRAYLPPQEVPGGHLKINVVEGYVAGIVVTGMAGADAEVHFTSTLAERPARLATFERDLLLLADRYGYKVASSQLLADPDDLAKYTLKIAVAVAGVSWRLYGDNRGNGESGSDQAFAWGGWNSVVASGDRLAASLFTLPSDTSALVFGDVSYARPWLAGDLWTEVGTSMSRTRNEQAGKNGEVDRLYARATVPVLRTRAQSLWATVFFDARDTAEVATAGAQTEEHTRVLRGSLSYTLVSGGTRTDVTVEGSRGLDALDASKNGDSSMTNADGRPQFSKVRLDATLTRKLADRLDMSFSFAGQLADGALVRAEEFGAGGARFGRAYNYSEITGDHGVAGSLELRYTLSDVFEWLKTVQVYAFADGALVWNRVAGPNEEDLSSAGLGVRLSPISGAVLSLELAQPLSRDVANKGDRGLRPFVTLQFGW